MPPARKRGAKGAKTKNELSLGDLVLAKVKGFPAWPAKISRPEDWKRVPDPKKYFVQFFGTLEIAFVAPADIQAFTIEAKNKLSARCQGKTVKHFSQAVKEICEQYEKLQHESSSGTRDDNSEQTLASEHSTDPVVNDILEVSEKVGIEMNESHCKTEINGLGELGSRLEHCLLRQGKISKISKDLTNLPSNVKKECSGNVKADRRHSDSGRSELANGPQKKLAMGSKKKPEGTVHKNSSSAVPHEYTGDRMQIKFSSDSNTKVSSTGNSKSVLIVGEEKRVAVDKTHCDSKDNRRVDAEINLEQSEVISRKRMKTQHGSEKHAFQSSVTTCPAKMPKCTDIGNDGSMSRSQRNRKNDSRSPNVLDGKMSDIELKRSTSDGIPQSQQPSRIQINNESDHFSDEDGLPPPNRHRRAFEVMPSSATASESKLGGSALHKNDSVRPNKVRSPVTQLPSKRRAVRLYDDDDDEMPKTPVHEGFTNKVSVTPRAPDSNSKKKSVVHGESCVNDQMFSRDRGTTDDRSKEHAQYARVLNKAPSPNFQLGLVKMAGELSAAHISSSLSHKDDEKLPSMEIRPVSATPEKFPRSITGARPLAEQQIINFSKEPGNVSQKKAPAGGNIILPTASDRLTSSPHEVIVDRSNPASSREKRNAAVKSDSRINDSSLMLGHPNKNFAPVHERVDVFKHDETSSSINAKIPESVMSMKHLIAAAQARKREAHLQSSFGFLFPLLDNESELHRKSPSPAPDTTVFESSNTQPDVQGLRSISPSADVHHLSSTSQHENEVLEERMLSSADHAIGDPLSGGTEAAVARDAFEGMIETLSRTKESIGRATRLAIDCAKYGIANEVVELLICKLENEPSLHHRVDLFFLVDSITQCSHSQKGIAGSSYIPTVRAALDRLIGAAAPPGAGAEENRRQVRKVLRLWIERKILPESVLRRYVDDIGVVNDDTSTGLLLHRPSRAERAIDDPLREMEGMFVDEYGSNATFQLPGLLSSRVFEEEDEEEDSLQTDFCKEIADTSPSERSPVIRDPENCTVTPSDRRHRILEDVDGELEMEDVSGHQKDEKLLFTDSTFEVASLEPNLDGIFTSASNKNAQWLPSPEDSPPLPPGSPPVTPPLPTSPPPPPSPLPLSTPPPPPLPPTPLSEQQLFPPLPIGPPPPVRCHQSLPPQPALMSQHMPSLPSSISTSSTLAFQPPPVLHEIGGTLTGNQHAHMVSSTQGFHIDASVRSEALSQQSSCFPPAGVGKEVEDNGFYSSRTVEYRQCDAYMNLQSSQHRQLPGSAPFAHRPLHPEPPPQHPPTHFSYPKSSVQQHQYPPYLLPNFSDCSRRYGADESWRMQVNEFSDSLHVGWMSAGRSCSGPPYPQEGYFEPPQERPHINAVNFQPPAPNSVAAAMQISVHGPPVIPGRPDMSAVNWRPA
ncbi:ENHANCER OF AG-4 protein 2-like isoform X2 [Primulina tabacum]|uniref:ENHANCER OF AG-4 protein 2-like isoform X2 n=1 Tax=Primulina tabacum TaxID=48773 RepID=UPI003F599A0F